jgi:hypothetical protein
MLDMAPGGQHIPITMMPYARHGGYHLALDVGVLEILGVAVGGDVLDDTVLEGDDKLALVPLQ